MGIDAKQRILKTMKVKMQRQSKMGKTVDALSIYRSPLGRQVGFATTSQVGQ